MKSVFSSADVTCKVRAADESGDSGSEHILGCVNCAIHCLWGPSGLQRDKMKQHPPQMLAAAEQKLEASIGSSEPVAAVYYGVGAKQWRGLPAGKLSSRRPPPPFIPERY